MINSLYLKNYKLFKELHIESLAKVNLIIGKNNVGKTSLLEAIMLFSDEQNIVHNLFNILQLRKLLPTTNLSNQQCLEILQTFFYHQTNRFEEDIFLGVDQQQGHHIFFSHNNSFPRQPTLVIQPANYTKETILFANFQQIFQEISGHNNHQIFISTRNEESDELLAQRWGQIALSDKEQYVIEGLKIIDNNIERLAVIDDGVHTKKAIIKLRDMKQPILLNTMGDGINVMLRTLLALVHCENGYLFIDEFAAGLHWSVQAALWQMIFQLSLQLNIQIFATTHSLDTLHALQQITKPDDSNVAVIKLQSFPKKNKIKAVHFKTQDIMIAVEQNIEVR
jgi:AAA15 family ATPase/GTPase